ncbi:MAG: hypothetical protein IKW81_12440 [Pseudobutyrivibrio sp.]|nr:hypothetical protein [Pseudobutyrivibrio sp.]
MEKHHLYGRIKVCNRKIGYAVIAAENGKRYYLPIDTRYRRSRIRLGALVDFNLESQEDNEYISNFNVINKFPNGNKIELPDGSILKMREISKFGISSGKNNVEIIGIDKDELHNHGIEEDELSYLYFKTDRGEYRFFNTGSPIVGDGQCDIFEVHKALAEKLYFVNEVNYDNKRTI